MIQRSWSPRYYIQVWGAPLCGVGWAAATVDDDQDVDDDDDDPIRGVTGPHILRL